MGWSPGDRRKFLRGLDHVESGLLVFYKYFLYVLIVVVTLLAVAFYRSVATDAFRDFLRLYGGILYIIFLAWALSQLYGIRGRQSRPPSDWTTTSPENPAIEMKSSRDPATGARMWSFGFGSGASSRNQGTNTLNLGFAATSLPEEDKLDDAALTQAEAYLTSGAGLDTVCRLLNPRYQSWSSPQQQVFRAYLQGQIALRRNRAPQANEILPSDQVEKTMQVSLPEASLPLAPSEPFTPRQSWFSLNLILIFFLLLLFFTATFLALMFFSKAARP